MPLSAKELSKKAKLAASAALRGENYIFPIDLTGYDIARIQARADGIINLQRRLHRTSVGTRAVRPGPSPVRRARRTRRSVY